MLDLSFLSTATITDVAESKAVHRTGARKQRNPESGLMIRVFRDGSIYPSADLVAKFDLDYRAKDSQEQGNGFDVVDTAQYPSFQVGKRILIISPATKNAGKVDLFASTTYNADGTPKATVLEQGAKTYGKEDLLPTLKEVYGIELSEEKDHVDLELVANPATGEPWTLPEGRQVTFLPKKVSRGKEKGTVSVIRRENPSFYALLPVSLIEAPETAEAQSAEAQPVPSPASVEAPSEQEAEMTLEA